MKVGELIKKLEIYNQNFEVEIEASTEEGEQFATTRIDDVGVFSSSSKSIIYISPK